MSDDNSVIKWFLILLGAGLVASLMGPVKFACSTGKPNLGLFHARLTENNVVNRRIYCGDSVFGRGEC